MSQAPGWHRQKWRICTVMNNPRWPQMTSTWPTQMARPEIKHPALKFSKPYKCRQMQPRTWSHPVWCPTVLGCHPGFIGLKISTSQTNNHFRNTYWTTCDVSHITSFFRCAMYRTRFPQSSSISFLFFPRSMSLISRKNRDSDAPGG